MLAHYTFITAFSIESALQPVWDTLMDFKGWPNWWESVKHIHVEELHGSHIIDVTIGSVAYTLSMVLTTTNIDLGRSISFDSKGDLVGYGNFLFDRVGNEVAVRFTWDVSTTKPWMNIVAPFARPVFSYSHERVMRKFVEGLSKKLSAPVIRQAFSSI